MRACVIAAVATAPLVFGAIDPRAYVPLLTVAYVTGAASWLGAFRARADGRAVPRLPGGRVLLALLALVLLQLVPLPPSWLFLISPGSYALYYIPPPVDLPAPWRPISVSPNDTLRGLAFLAGMSLLYATVFRELREERWRRRLCAALAGTGLILTVVALVQAASPEPTKIYGLFRPQLDWAVFGPYVNRNHFAGYMAMVVPLGFGFAAEAVRDAAARFRRLGLWRALGEREVSALGRRAAVAVVLLVGLLAPQSRGGIVAGAVSLAVFLLMFRRRWQALAFVGLLLLVGLLTVDLSAVQRGFETRGFNRLEMWRDMLQLVPQFPLLGAGLNAFGLAFRPYQTVGRFDFWSEAHNDYLQALFDTGIVGAVLALLLLLKLGRAAARQVGRGALTAGVVAGVTASAVHALVDFNWQIPANAAAFVALAGLVMQERG